MNKLIVNKYGRDFQFYPWIKARIFNVLILGEETLQKKTSKVFFQQLRSLFYGFSSLFGRYDAWTFTNSAERVLIDDKYIDKGMDALFFQRKEKSLVVELLLHKFHKRKQVYSKHVVSKASFIFLEELYLRFFLRRISFTGESILDEIESVTKAKVDVHSILQKYLAQYRVMKYALKILPKPKVVFLTVSYANFGYIKAWKEAGIRVVELQHGLIGETNPGYMYTKRFDSNQFPDELLVFGEKDKELIEKSRFPINKCVPIGRFIIDYYAGKAKPNKAPIQSILVSLQDTEWSVALLEFILECDKAMQNKIEWIIQPRRTSEEHYREIYQFPNNFQFSSVSIYEKMIEVDAHLTIFSTTAIESLSIGKPTFLYNYKNASEEFLGEILAQNNNVYFCSAVQDFITKIQTLPLRSVDEISQSNNEVISVNYKENIKKYLDSIFNEA